MKIIYILIILFIVFASVPAQEIPEFIRITGIGFIPLDIDNLTQAKLIGRRHALVNGYKNLAETIKGIYITSETKIGDLITKYEKINEKVKAVIKSAYIVDERYLSDGIVEIDFFIDKQAIREIIALSEELQIKDSTGNWKNPSQVSMAEWTDIIYEKWAESQLSFLPIIAEEDSIKAPSEIINGNFEDTTLVGWTFLGNTWENNPLRYSQGGNAQGKYYLSSDPEAQGCAISNKFMITKAKIIFCVAGGRNPSGRPNETTVNLIINGETIYSVAGSGDDTFREVIWDMGHHQGSIAQIKIIDANSGKDGYIFVDNIRMTN